MKKLLLLPLMALSVSPSYAEFAEDDEVMHVPEETSVGPIQGPQTPQTANPSGVREQNPIPTPPRPNSQTTITPMPLNITIDFSKPFDQIEQDVQKAKMKIDMLDVFLKSLAQVMQESEDMKAMEQKFYANYLDFLRQQKQLSSMGPKNFQDKYGFSIDQTQNNHARMLGMLSPIGQQTFAYAQKIVNALSQDGFMGGISPRVTSFINFIQEQLAGPVKAPQYSIK